MTLIVPPVPARSVVVDVRTGRPTRELLDWMQGVYRAFGGSVIVQPPSVTAPDLVPVASGAAPGVDLSPVTSFGGLADLTPVAAIIT